MKNKIIFNSCGAEPIGIYPIVASVKECEQIISSGISMLQLRIKDKINDALEQEIKHTVALCHKHGVRLFLNDYWQLAIKYKTFGVHLGQEDLNDADIDAITCADLRLGISTHNLSEVERALVIKPSYLAIGPVYPTTSKEMVYQPQGLNKLAYWQEKLNYPLVAIGGINENNIKEVIKTGVNGISMISAITQAADPYTATKKFIELYKNRKI